MTEPAKVNGQPNPALHPGNRLAARSWQSPWRAWQLAFQTRRSFGMAAAFGAISAILQALMITLAGLTISSLFFSNQPPISAALGFRLPDLIFGLGYFLFMFIYGYFILYLGSQFINPEVRLLSGFENLRIGWAALGAGIFSLVFYLVPLGSLGFGGLAGLNFNRMGMWEQLYGLVTALPFFLLMQLVIMLAARISIRWPEQRKDARVPLSKMMRSPRFYLTLLLLSLSSWLVWAGVTAASIAISIGLIASIPALFFIFVPVSLIIVSGYTLMVFGSIAVAPFRVAGWTLEDGETLSTVFE